MLRRHDPPARSDLALVDDPTDSSALSTSPSADRFPGTMLKFIKHLWDDTHPKIARYFWTFVGYLLSQVGVQFINMITGFVIIRLLVKDEYATYTIINTLIPVMLLLSDTGIGTGMISIGRRHWEDDKEMGSLINTGMAMRRKFAFFALFFFGPFMCWMLYRNNAQPLTIVLLAAASLTGISFQMSSAVLKVVLELRQKIKTLGKVSLAMAAFRLALVGIFSAAFQFSAFWATVAGTCAIIFETSYLIRAVRPQIAWTAAPSPVYQSEIMGIVKKTLPLTIYFCVQGQISIWLISIFGSSHQVADLGAATRLSIIYSTVSGSFLTIMMPRFARNNGRKRLTTQYVQIMGGLLVILACFIVVTKVFPEPFVWLLGPQYKNLSSLIWVVILSQGMSSIAGVSFGLNMSKGWVPPALLTIPIEVATQILLFSLLDLSNILNVLIFACLSAVPPTVMLTILLFRHIAKETEE